MPSRVLVLGATGTIGRATVRALLAQGHEVVCLIRLRALAPVMTGRMGHTEFLSGATVRVGDATDPVSLVRDGLKGEHFDVLVSCLASRTGEPHDAWAVDHRAMVSAIEAARAAGVQHVVLLSAICVQKPLLAFQHAKLAAERALIDSGLRYSIVRPTAFFKSLSGQVERVRRGKPFLLFGDGRLTACKPISDADLGAFIASCITDPSCHDRILPIGGPGPAMTPREQGEALFRLLGREPRFRRVPVQLMDVIVAVLTTLGRVFPRLADTAELARIGRYYATESMLVMDPVSGRYDADATPSTGKDTLLDFHAALLRGEASLDRGDHAVF
jgi:divinyl chlorophyllide a 8-vinyl-reductase